MKTKTGLFCISIVASWLLFATNVLASYTVTVPGGFTYYPIANHLDHVGGDTLDQLIPNPPDGTQLLKWDCVSYQVAATYDGFGGQWDTPGVTLNPGEGAFIVSGGGSFTIIFTGNVHVPVFPNPFACPCDGFS